MEDILLFLIFLFITFIIFIIIYFIYNYNNLYLIDKFTNNNCNNYIKHENSYCYPGVKGTLMEINQLNEKCKSKDKCKGYILYNKGNNINKGYLCRDNWSGTLNKFNDTNTFECQTNCQCPEGYTEIKCDKKTGIAICEPPIDNTTNEKIEELNNTINSLKKTINDNKNDLEKSINDKNKNIYLKYYFAQKLENKSINNSNWTVAGLLDHVRRKEGDYVNYYTSAKIHGLRYYINRNTDRNINNHIGIDNYTEYKISKDTFTSDLTQDGNYNKKNPTEYDKEFIKASIDIKEIDLNDFNSNSKFINNKYYKYLYIKLNTKFYDDYGYQNKNNVDEIINIKIVFISSDNINWTSYEIEVLTGFSNIFTTISTHREYNYYSSWDVTQEGHRTLLNNNTNIDIYGVYNNNTDDKFNWEDGDIITRFLQNNNLPQSFTYIKNVKSSINNSSIPINDGKQKQKYKHLYKLEFNNNDEAILIFQSERYIRDVPKKNGYKNSYESSPYNPCIIIGLKNNKFYLSGIAPLLRNIHYTSEKEYYLPVLNRHRDFNNSTNYKSLFIEMSSKPF